MVPATTGRSPVRTVVIANISEFYLPVFRHFHEKEMRAWVEPSRAECDMTLFWSGDDKLVITPYPIDRVFVSDVCAILGYRNARLVSPSKTSESLCADIEADPELFALLVEVLRNSEKPQIVGWGATKPFYTLADRLRQEGVEFTTPEVPAVDDYWTVPYLDSKCGFREVCTHLSRQAPDIRIPRGFVCADIDVAVRIAKSGVFSPGGVVVKANDGVGGYGTLLYSPERFRQHFDFDIEAHLYMSARLMPIFSAGTIVVEAYIESQAGSEIASPSIQGIVDPSGRVSIACLAGQIIGPEGRYIGALISPGIFPAPLVESLHRIGHTIGEASAALGYRGVFNIDTVLDKNGLVYCVELNARRTSVKYILDVATRLFGASFADSVAIMTNERFSSKQLSGCSYSNIRSLLAKLLFPIDGKPQGVVVTIASSLAHFARIPQLGFVVIGEDITVARSIYSKVCQLLGERTLGSHQTQPTP